APSIEAAMGWILRRCEEDPRGLLTYTTGAGGRLRNQGWKDSSDAICFPDAALAPGPIALVEAQGYAIDGLIRGAGLMEREGRTSLVEPARARAELLRKSLIETFFDERGGCALAVDGTGTPVPTRTSNPGHLLFSGALDRERAAQVASDMLAGGLWT